jgi:beta-lactamase class D
MFPCNNASSMKQGVPRIKTGRRILKIFLTGSFLSVTSLNADTPRWPGPLSDYAHGESACIAVYSKNDEQYLVHNPDQCQERLSPCSTFKIPNALIGLETGSLSGPGDAKTWDGTLHSREVLNQDHDLAGAIRNSVVWYFQELALEIGSEQMQAYLDLFDYGNRDISGGQDHFWLSSSLEITALEQIRFMSALNDEILPVGKEHQATVKAMMRQDYALPESFNGALYGKTGSCISPAGNHGWFTGFLNRDDQEYIFAINVKGEKAWGLQARAIAIEVLQDIR